MAFALTSTVLVEQGVMPDKYTLAAGDNVSPPLSWSGAPEGTRSFALSCVDPDVPWGNFGLPNPGTLFADLFVHWAVYDIPRNISTLGEGAGSAVGLPQGAKQLNNTANDFGADSPFYQYREGYIGCAPPAGDRAHRYLFTLYALDSESLGVAADGHYRDYLESLKGKVLATASLQVYFGVKPE